MTIKFSISTHQIPTGKNYYRVQRQRAMQGTVRKNGLFLRPAVGLMFRFDLEGQSTAYMGDSKLTAIYESVLRRETTACTMSFVEQRSLATLETKRPLMVADLRALGEKYPVLISQRYRTTQQFAQHCVDDGLDGVIYSSAQHPGHDCVALFDSGIKKVRVVEVEHLVKPDTEQLLRVFVDALEGAQIQLI